MAKFEGALRSFAVDSKLKRSAQLAQAYKLEGVPAMAVNGRYLVPASNNMLSTVEYLIGQSRGQGAARK
jgi:thiol:disulfide interchange protein DsbA